MSMQMLISIRNTEAPSITKRGHTNFHFDILPKSTIKVEELTLKMGFLRDQHTK